MSVQKWGVIQHTSVFSVFSACDTEETEETGVFVSICVTLRGFSSLRCARLPEMATPPWGDMAAAGALESGAVTLDSYRHDTTKNLLQSNPV